MHERSIVIAHFITSLHLESWGNSEVNTYNYIATNYKSMTLYQEWSTIMNYDQTITVMVCA